jgi:membrane-associated protease RseP (regulator of RpoE activity)
MALALAILFFVLAVAIHELGHAWAMREAGIKVERLGIGLPLQPNLVIRSNFLRRIFGARFRLSISPWILGAYVKPYGQVEIHDRKVSLREDVYISGAGPIANIIMLFLFSAVLILLENDLGTKGAMHYYFGIQFVGYGWVIASGFFVAAVLTWVFRKWIALYLLLPIGVYVVYKTIDIMMGMSFGTLVASSGGLVLISEIASKTTSVRDAVYFGMTINFLLAFTNLLPFHPFDGGRITTSLLRKVTSKGAAYIQRVGMLLVYTLIIFCLYADGVRLLNYFH